MYKGKVDQNSDQISIEDEDITNKDTLEAFRQLEEGEVTWYPDLESFLTAQFSPLKGE